MNRTLKPLLIFALLLTTPVMGLPQTKKPSLNKTAPKPLPKPIVPVGTNLKIRLNDTLTSKESRAGDKFTATVMDPVRFNEATLHGHVRSIVKSGKVKGKTTMNLSFDSIDMPDGKHAVLHGYVTRVYGSESGKTDDEGGVESDSRGKQTVKRTGVGATAGAILGGIMGGGKGAAIGLILGGAAGAGSLAVKGSKELKLESGTEMLIHVTK